MSIKKSFTSVVIAFAVLLLLQSPGCKDKGSEPELEPGFHLIGQYHTMSPVYGLFVTPEYTYLADSIGLLIMGTSDPARPVKGGEVATAGWSSDVVVDAGRAYVVQGTDGLSIIDVSNPVLPVELGLYDPEASVNAVEVVNNYAYLACSHTDYSLAGLYIVDIQDPANCTLVGYVDSIRADALAISGNYAYVLGHRYYYGNMMSVVDISDPAFPVPLSSLAGAYGYDLELMGMYIFVCTGSALTVIDLYNPLIPRIVSQLYVHGAVRVCLSETYAYLAGISGIEVIDITNLADCRSVAELRTSEAHDIAYYDGYIYLANESPGFQIFKYVPGEIEEEQP